MPSFYLILLHLILNPSSLATLTPVLNSTLLGLSFSNFLSAFLPLQRQHVILYFLFDSYGIIASTIGRNARSYNYVHLRLVSTTHLVQPTLSIFSVMHVPLPKPQQLPHVDLHDRLTNSFVINCPFPLVPTSLRVPTPTLSLDSFVYSHHHFPNSLWI